MLLTGDVAQRDSRRRSGPGHLHVPRRRSGQHRSVRRAPSRPAERRSCGATTARAGHRRRRAAADEPRQALGPDEREPASFQSPEPRHPAVRSSWLRHAGRGGGGVADAVPARLRMARGRATSLCWRAATPRSSRCARALRMRGVPVRTQLRSDFFAQAEVRPLLAYLRVVADPHHTLELYMLATGWPYELGGEHLTDLLSRARRRQQSRSGKPLLKLSTQTDRGLHAFAGRRRGWSSTCAPAIDLWSTNAPRQRFCTTTCAAAAAWRGWPASADPSGRSLPSPASSRSSDRVLACSRRIASPFLVPHLDALIEADDEPADTGPLDLDAVSVLTVHRAKGLEFSVVYLTGLVDGRFPARGRPPTLTCRGTRYRPPATPRQIELDEERRLCFVAMTRARDELWLSHHSLAPGGRGAAGRRPSSPRRWTLRPRLPRNRARSRSHASRRSVSLSRPRPSRSAASGRAPHSASRSSRSTSNARSATGCATSSACQRRLITH